MIIVIITDENLSTNKMCSNFLFVLDTDLDSVQYITRKSHKLCQNNAIATFIRLISVTQNTLGLFPAEV